MMMVLQFTLNFFQLLLTMVETSWGGTATLDIYDEFPLSQKKLVLKDNFEEKRFWVSKIFDSKRKCDQGTLNFPKHLYKSLKNYNVQLSAMFGVL